MKGHPFTRKTEFAEAIATSLRCPILSTEDILDGLTPPLSPEKEFEAFKVICNIASRQINRGKVENVVIDSPLSSKSHFNHLLNCLKGARMIVIECKPTNTYSWKLKFEEHLARRQSRYGDEVKWYKPKKWGDVEKAIVDDPDYDDHVNFVIRVFGFVSKLVVDPLLDCPFEDSDYGTRRLVEAVKYLMKCEGSGVAVYRSWLQVFPSSSTTLVGEKHCSEHGHDIVPNPKMGKLGSIDRESSEELEGIQHDETTVDCMVCKRQVVKSNNIGGAYCYCKNCSLTLHMECALSSRNEHAENSRWSFYNNNSRISCDQIFGKCGSCKEGEVTDESIWCKACRFNFHLRQYRYCPIAIKHFDTKEHFLTILFSHPTKEIYRCLACGQNSKEQIMYLCKDCGTTYHYDCVTMPHRVKNVHGGHHHHLSLKFDSEEAEDYLCQECQELRDPMLWYYSCEDCPGYELHPYCVTKLIYTMEIAKPDEHSKLDRELYCEEEAGQAAQILHDSSLEMKESESISDFYSREIYWLQWYGIFMDDDLVVLVILGKLPLKFYHTVVAIKRSKDYKSMTVDQLMICLRVYEKRIDNGEVVLIEQVLDNLYVTQQCISRRQFYSGEGGKWKINKEDVSLESVVSCDYSEQKSGDNWVKYWGKYWDKYWINYQRGYYSHQDKSKVQCSICYMFGHGPRHCWGVSKMVKMKPLKIKIKFKILLQNHSSQKRSTTKITCNIHSKE